MHAIHRDLNQHTLTKQVDATPSSTLPRISVVLCTYNGDRFLEEQLTSILVQTLQPFEMVVCDDGSTDGTMAILRSFASAAAFPVAIHCNPQTLGSTRNFDQGIRMVQGELIVLCDQDDFWEPRKLQRLSEVMGNEACAGVFTDGSLIGEDGSLLEGRLWARAGFSFARETEFLRDPVGVLLRQDVATGATMMFRSSVRDLYGAIPPEWVHDGWLAWMMVLHRDEVGGLLPLREPLIRYRIHEAQQTGQTAARIGSSSEPLAQRLAKARVVGHVHHRETAVRLSGVLDYWKRSGGTQHSVVFRRLQGTIRLLERRAALPRNRVARLAAVIAWLPSYLRYGGGFLSAGRDLWI